MVRSDKSKMVAKMASDFLENGYIQKLATTTCFYLVLGTQNDYIIRFDTNRMFHAILLWLNIKNIFQGPENHTKLVKF